MDQAVKKKQSTIAICEDDVVFRYQLLEDLPVLAPIIKNTNFDVIAMHHYCDKAGVASKMIPVPEEKEIKLLEVDRKPWCNQILILSNLDSWWGQLHCCTTNPKHIKRTLDHVLTVCSSRSFVTSKEYAFQLDDYSNIRDKVYRRFKQKARYKDIITT